MVNIGGICESDGQCNGTEFANVCDDRLCVCNSGYIQNENKCYKGKIFHHILSKYLYKPLVITSAVCIYLRQ